MQKFNCKQKTAFLLILLFLITFLLTALIAVNIKIVYADNSIGDYNLDEKYWKDNFKWKDNMRPQYTNCSITRIGTNRYRVNASIEMGDGIRAGVGWWTCDILYNETSVAHIDKVNEADKKHTFSGEFNHNDKLPIKIKIKVLSNWGSVNAENTSATKTFDAYNTTPPTGTLSGVTNGGTTNSNVSFTWTESNCTATLNGQSYTSGTSITGEENGKKNYTLILTDIANKKTTYTFTIDKTPPNFTIKDENRNVLNDTSITNKNVYVEWDSSQLGTLSIKRNNGNYISEYHTTYYYDSLLPSEKWFNKSDLTENIKNKEKASVKTGPYSSGSVAEEDKNDAIVGKTSYLYKGLYYFKESTLNKAIASEANNRIRTVEKWFLTEDGSYQFTFKNTLGTETSKKITIDKVAPEGVLSGVTNGGGTNKTVSFSWTESNCTATLNGKPYTSGTTIFPENGQCINYTIILKDLAGNTKTYSFTIDREGPTGTLTGVKHGGITKENVSFTWTEANCTATLNGRPYTKGSIISTDGNYTLILKDEHDNSTKYTFMIDQTAPIGTLIGVTNRGITNQNVSFTWNEGTATATLNGRPYTKGSIISTDGDYKIIIKDTIENTREYTFTIDKTPPEGTLDGVTNNGITNTDVTFSWTEANCTATLNGSPYTKGSNIDTEYDTLTEYTLILSDKVGNKKEYKFTIDKRLPILEFFKDGIKIDIPAGDEVFFINKNLIIKYSNSLIVKINDTTLDSNSSESTYELKADNNKFFSYKIEITNSLGNKNTYTITIDKKPPTENLNYFLSRGKNFINHWWESYDASLVDGRYVITNYYSFPNYISAKNFAMKRESQQFEEGEYNGSGKIYCNYAKDYVDGFDTINPKLGQKYIIYKDANNQNKLIAYFDNSKLINAQQLHSERSIYERFIPAIPKVEYDKDTVFIKEIFLSGNDFGFESSLKNCEVYYTHNPNANERDFIKTDYNVRFTGGYTKILEIDKAGNKVSYIIYLDNEAPYASAVDTDNNSLSILTDLLNGERETLYWASPFTLFIDDTLDMNSVLCISNNNTVLKRIFTQENSSGYTFDNSGIYEIEWYDKVGNKKTKTLYLAIEEIKVSFVETKDTNHRVVGFEMKLDKINKFNNIEGITIEFTSLDGNTFNLSSSTTPSFDFNADKLSYTFNINGTYKISIVDSFGRNSYYEYMLQKDLPVGKIYDKASNEELANKSTVGGPIYLKKGQGVYFTWEDDTLSCKYSINDGDLLDYISNTLITGIDEQVAKITFYLSSDNLTSQYTIFIDLEPLYINCDGVEENAATNKNVTLSWNSTSKGSVSVKFKNQNPKRILNYTTFSESGIYSVLSTDEFGNTYLFEFTIDKNAPGILAYTKSGSLINGIYTNKDFFFTWGGESVTATLNGILYEEDSIINADGNYTLILVDYLGNSSTITIIRDTVLQDAIFTGLNDNNWANGIVTAIWSEEDVTATLNGENYISGSNIDTEFYTLTEYTLILSDKAGNKKEYKFTISRVMPKGTLTGVEDGGITNKNVSFSWYKSYYQVTLNGENYISGTLIKAENDYTLIISDTRSNNSTTYTFTIDKTAPEGELSGVENGGITNTDVSFSWTESNCTATLNDVIYISGTKISESGYYTIILKDLAGNKTTYTFTIDKIPPKGKLNGVENGGITNKNVSFSWTESNCTATLNEQNYSLGIIIKESGKYEIKLCDAVGNISTYTFTIDKSLPYGTFYDEYDNFINSNDNLAFNFNIYVNFNDEFTAKLNGVDYISNSLITEEGDYELIITNVLGNSISYQIKIDKTPPKGTLTGVENGGVTNKNVILTWYETQAFCNISFNNSSFTDYTSGTILKEAGNYSLILSDVVGNIIEYKFTIIKEKPFASSIGLNENNFSNNSVVFYFSNEFTATLNGGNYVSGTSITEEGEYELIVYNCINAYTTYTFTIDKTAPIITITNKLNDTISDTYISVPFYVKTNKNCNIFINDELYNSQLIQKNNAYYITAIDLAGNSSTIFINLNNDIPEIVFNVDFVNNKTAKNVSFCWSDDDYDSTVTLNDVHYLANTLITEEGTYHVFIVNKYGSSNTYTFTIDKTLPNFTISGVENGGVTNKNVKIDFNSNYDCSFIINNDKETIFDYRPNNLFEGTSGVITQYEVTLINQLGATVTITFTIDKTSPDGVLSGVENGGITNKDVIFSWTESNCTATLNGENYISGTTIEIPSDSKLKFELILSNYIGNTTTYTFTIDKTLPMPFTNIPDKIITKDFSIKFAEEFTATLNGVPYKSGELITESGLYDLILIDTLGNYSSHKFTIDKEDLSFIVNMNDEDIAVDKNKTFNYAISIITDKKFTINGAEQHSGYILDIAGEYEIVIYSSYGTSATYTIKLVPPPSKYSTGDVIVFVLLGCIGISLIIGFSIVVFKTVKTNKKKII